MACLKGNHEDALLRFLADPADAPAWIDNWGEATLRAYGVVYCSGVLIAVRLEGTGQRIIQATA